MRIGGRSAIFLFKPVYSELPRLEACIDRIQFSSPEDRNSVKIVATELFDNIVAHAEGVRPSLVGLQVKSLSPPEVCILYRTSNFRQFMDALEAAVCSRAGVDAAARPDFDKTSDRYRGLGLRMCAALSRDICARPGLFCQRISVVF